MSLSQHRINIPGWIGVACLLFVWTAILLPKSLRLLLPVFDKIGPFSWLIPLAMILLPIVAAKRGSKFDPLVQQADDMHRCFDIVAIHIDEFMPLALLTCADTL